MLPLHQGSIIVYPKCTAAQCSSSSHLWLPHGMPLLHLGMETCLLQYVSNRANQKTACMQTPNMPTLVCRQLPVAYAQGHSVTMHAAQQQHQVLCINAAIKCCAVILPSVCSLCQRRRPAHLAHVADVDRVLADLGDCERDVAHAAGTPAGRAGGHSHSVAHPGLAHQHALRELLQQLVPCRASNTGRSKSQIRCCCILLRLCSSHQRSRVAKHGAPPKDVQGHSQTC